MGLADTQRLLARLYTDPRVREQFFAHPATVAAQLSVPPADLHVLSHLPRTEITRFARSLQNKRLGDTAKLLPLTRRALGRHFAPRFLAWADRGAGVPPAAAPNSQRAAEISTTSATPTRCGPEGRAPSAVAHFLSKILFRKTLPTSQHHTDDARHFAAHLLRENKKNATTAKSLPTWITHLLRYETAALAAATPGRHCIFLPLRFTPADLQKCARSPRHRARLRPRRGFALWLRLTPHGRLRHLHLALPFF